MPGCGEGGLLSPTFYEEYFASAPNIDAQKKKKKKSKTLQR
jgi:hypothetical protein